MQYLVRTKGLSIDPVAKDYIILADSKEDAVEIARNNFCDDYYSIGDFSAIEAKPQKRGILAVLSIVLMMIPVILSFINWTNGHQIVNIKPDLISCIFAVLLYGSFVVKFKGLSQMFSSVIDILFWPVMILFLSAFIQLVLTQDTVSLLGYKEFSIDTRVLLVVAIIVSWIGLKLVSVICLAGVMFFSLTHIVAINNSMGSVWGSLFIICSGLGFLMYLFIEPGVREAIPFYKSALKHSKMYMKNDFIQANKTISKMAYTAKETNKKIKDRENR